MRKFLVISIFIAFVLAETGIMTVTGESTYEMKPDVIQISFAVIKDGLTASEAQDVHRKIVNHVLDTIQKYEVTPGQIKSDNYSLYQIFPENKKERALFRSAVKITVELYRVSDLGPLIDAVLAVGDVEIVQIVYTLKAEDDIRNEALGAAIKVAKTKAQFIADELNLQLAQAVSVSENIEVIQIDKDDKNKNYQNLKEIKARVVIEYHINSKE